ncbi:MAG: hypothetical protein BLITH_0259 [Brockia lithotrophica]|uniref:Uncharacterized protein n=1 Tax=Brockia lithotrophica TaxID=933949 RepID=A0A2T5GAG5_9BACL|nr:hypothetical protein [Brockia lithotrophica]MBT9253686.1 hypothetical protein [Brockia lithotrophica]PTQ53179.1 MAG: hypothetical protein BLITH_0259 [Brockia lithotrophica]
MRSTRASALRSLAWFFLGLGWGAALMLVESGDELSRAMLEKRELEGEIARLHKLLAEERERPLGPTAIRRLEIHFVGPSLEEGEQDELRRRLEPQFAELVGVEASAFSRLPEALLYVAFPRDIAGESGVYRVRLRLAVVGPTTHLYVEAERLRGPQTPAPR